MIELHSTEVPAAERFEWWRDVTAQQMYPTVISSEQTDDFQASVTVLPLGPVLVTAPQYMSMRTERTPRLIRRADPEWWVLTLVSSGSLWFEQSRTRTTLARGDLSLHDTSRPFQGEIVSQGRLARTVSCQLPRQALPLPEQLLRGCTARPLPSRQGTGALLCRFMEGLLEQARGLSPDEYAGLARTAIDLLAVYLAGVADAARTVPAHTHQQVLARQIKTFIQHHLHRPDLSRSLIAAAHHISVRYLHRIFQQEELTVSGYIREQRMQRCRADLADGRLTGRSVAEIAARWGFTDAASFSRAFRTAYGVPPSEYRKLQRILAD
ncbi:helix-turn-helix domain-containing protein [Nonomuraea antimicrobica]|uniref:Helix-turn-helix domain-containing protein n=1 Tax=Nonomuraea antimicrobica TaxID=561173 RepID=A0ABP7C504_9ACTN